VSKTQLNLGRPVTLPPQTRLQVWIDAEVDEDLRERAAKTDASMGRIVNAALRKYLKMPAA
jgi:hypothetical protein